MADAPDINGGGVPSPCVRNCCLDEFDVCMGCYRTMAEIMRWSEAGADERREILARCGMRREQRRDRRPGP
ncbi:MAG: DUF1289 domain-containing protein [Gammaproteobacteria bacterium]|nr:DUF1289 domain-containing protein [Gammaproteobacteria bacterium]